MPHFVKVFSYTINQTINANSTHILIIHNAAVYSSCCKYTEPYVASDEELVHVFHNIDIQNIKPFRVSDHHLRLQGTDFLSKYLNISKCKYDQINGL